LPLHDTQLIGALGQVYPHGVFRAALNAGGRHGGHALRHGLDWLVASAMGLPLYELFMEKKDAPPQIKLREPLASTALASQVLSTLLATRQNALQSPLCFLPKSGYAWWKQAQDDAGKALEVAQKAWAGSEGAFGGPGEARAATLIALRGRDPFLDGDLDSRDAFELLSHLLFSALERGENFDAGTLP
jgi:exodeoxyribonuclease V gamma subunit